MGEWGMKKEGKIVRLVNSMGWEQAFPPAL
jgi:hypothetical protein